jgi:hypothetical protein
MVVAGRRLHIFFLLQFLFVRGLEWECAIGHNSPPQFCTGRSVRVTVFDTGAEVTVPSSSHRDAVVGESVIGQWNVTVGEGAASSASSARTCGDAPAFFFVIPYNDAFDGKVNYYHYHVDVLLPLFVAFQRKAVLGGGGGHQVSALLVPTVSRLDWHSSSSSSSSSSLSSSRAFDWNSPAFSDPETHWVRALQAMTDEPLQPFAAGGLGRMAGVQSCFPSAHFGLPSVEHPSSSTVKRFVKFMRSRLRLPDSPVPCDAADEIGLVRRTNRRLLLNEAELVASVVAATGATVRFLDFGSGYEADVAAVQSLRVLLGVQGSGLINGWYLPPHSGVVVLYQLGAWDVFDEYLTPRGPYSYWTNGDPDRSFCNKTIDRFCDSPDTLVDIPAATKVIVDSLAASRQHCNDSATGATPGTAAAATRQEL